MAEHDVPNCLSDAAWHGREPAQSCTFSDARAEAVRVLEAEATRPFKAAAHLPTFALVCANPARCPTEFEGRVVDRDHSHLTAVSSKALSAPLEIRMESLFPALVAQADAGDPDQRTTRLK